MTLSQHKYYCNLIVRSFVNRGPDQQKAARLWSAVYIYIYFLSVYIQAVMIGCWTWDLIMSVAYLISCLWSHWMQTHHVTQMSCARWVVAMAWSLAMCRQKPSIYHPWCQVQCRVAAWLSLLARCGQGCGWWVGWWWCVAACYQSFQCLVLRSDGDADSFFCFLCVSSFNLIEVECWLPTELSVLFAVQVFHTSI